MFLRYSILTSYVLLLSIEKVLSCKYFRGSEIDVLNAPLLDMHRKLNGWDDQNIQQQGDDPDNNGGQNWRRSRPPSSSSTSSPIVGTLGTCRRGSLSVSSESICSAYQEVRVAFEAVTSDVDTQSNIFGISVRLAFHDAGEFDQNADDLLGPDGCLSSSEMNAGLHESDSLVVTVLEPIWQSVCDRISRADFWVLFAKLAIEKADPTDGINIRYQFGRKDRSECSAGAGRLPDADFGTEEFERVFVDQMGLTLADAITLIGAHTIGHTHIVNEGYGQLLSEIDPPVSADLVNAWDDGPNVFDNHYYRILAGGPTWTHFLSTGSEETEWHIRPGSPFIMLNSDLALAFSPILNGADPPEGIGQQCGATALQGGAGCVNPLSANLPTSASQVQGYIADNALFLSDFAKAFTRMSTVGYGCVGSDVGNGRLGTLENINLRQCSNNVVDSN